ncbi:MAG: 2-hydroxyglutaryl-CoA dehydratase [Actinobacteria bacterium]|nr:2-hydroxyglutaryl-CoA dehydratase [Actinomycetota bacterium]
MTGAAAIGVDAGSTTCKVVAVDETGALLASRLEATHPRLEEQAAGLITALVGDLGPVEPPPVVATGYGRQLVRGAARRVTEITCHARGVFGALGHGGTLVDIGGQDAKAIRIGEEGRPIDFAMNDKCAAGTGRFLEHTAGRLGVAVADLGPRALGATAEEPISSTCTVFAESEIISLIGRGADLDAIIRGLHRSLVGRIVAMARTVGLGPPLILSGGVALNPGVRAMMEEATGMAVILPPHPQLTGAYGAALIALEG